MSSPTLRCIVPLRFPGEKIGMVRATKRTRRVEVVADFTEHDAILNELLFFAERAKKLPRHLAFALRAVPFHLAKDFRVKQRMPAGGTGEFVITLEPAPNGYVQLLLSALRAFQVDFDRLGHAGSFRGGRLVKKAAA